MKRMKFSIMVSMAFISISALCIEVSAQDAKPRKSPKAMVSQRIGVDTDILINYSRPGVKGRKIWGDIVPYGMYPGNKYSNEKPFPWRAGADENTTIEFNKDLMVNGQKLQAGKYSIHMVAGEKEFQVMFNKKSDGWGSYTYNAEENALSITVTPVEAPHAEWLEFGFDELGDYSATAFLKWANLKIPFRLELVK